MTSVEFKVSKGEDGTVRYGYTITGTPEFMQRFSSEERKNEAAEGSHGISQRSKGAGSAADAGSHRATGEAHEEDAPGDA